MLTAFDVGVAVLLLISAILATARGFTREVLSLATWVGSAAIAAYLFFYQPHLLDQFFADELISKIVLTGGAFLVALIVLHLITMSIADFVVDSRIGPLDRTLGFVFGVARGVVIVVVAMIFVLWLIPNPGTWVTESKSLPIIQKMGDDLTSALANVLPEEWAKVLEDAVHGRAAGEEEESPPDTNAAPEGTLPPDDSTDEPENDAPMEPVEPPTNT